MEHETAAAEAIFATRKGGRPPRVGTKGGKKTGRVTLRTVAAAVVLGAVFAATRVAYFGRWWRCRRAPPGPGAVDVDIWLDAQVPFSLGRMLAHVRDSGAVVAGAAPPFDAGDLYQYYWVRDGGLTMMALADLYAETGSPDVPPALDAFFNWTLRTQKAAREYNPPDMWFDEPQAWTKYTLDGIPYHNWASPQYDGPALRALAFIKYGNHTGRFSEYYDADDDASVVKADLDAVARVWNNADGYEPWEDIQGRHFFVSAVQYRALADGAEMVRALGDRRNADRYRSAARRIKAELLGRFWDGRVLKATVDADPSQRIENDGANYKVQKGYFVDVATILGVIHGSDADTFPATDPRTQATFYELINAFAYNAYKPEIVLSDWSLNKWETSVGGRPVNPAIGRFPEDVYDGLNYKYPGAHDHVSSGAGFWFLATNAMAEMLYGAVVGYVALGSVEIGAENRNFWEFVGGYDDDGGSGGGDGERLRTIEKGTPEFLNAMSLLIDHGDRFLRRVRRHVSDEGYMSEQFHFRTGHMHGTRDLCWSYASVVTAHLARRRAVAAIGTL